VIAYIREYPGWIQSFYAQKTKKGKNALDFDAFFAREVQRLSALPALQRWAEALGWENVRVRPLETGSLRGGTLMSDFLDALEIEPAEDLLPSFDDQNVSPPWPMLELRRLLAQLRRDDTPGSHDWAAEHIVARNFAKCLEAGPPPPPVQYLTQAQFGAAASLYNRDLAVLGAKTGTRFAPSALHVAERPFCPTFDRIPAELRRQLVRRLGRRIASARWLPTREAPHLEALSRVRDVLDAAP
jgi:hypothetical protein